MSPIDQMLAAKSIAIVGLSDDPSRTSHQIGRYLLEHGFAIAPVNPHAGEVFGIKSVATLSALDEAPDVVLVFRRSEFCEAIAKEAVGLGARGLWLQSGITSASARHMAATVGMAYVEDRCIYIEHARRSK